MHRYDIAADQIHPLRGFENFIFAYRRGRDAYILRINHTMNRSVPMICGEADWINYLAAGGASVARAVASPAGNMVEQIADEEGGFFLATAFVKAKGQPPWDAGWTPERYENYGRLIGRIHTLTKQYEPPDPSWKRGNPLQAILGEIRASLPPSEVVAIQKYEELLDHVSTLPKDRDSYGLIHCDAHENNIFIAEDDTITLFDFDDMSDSWFIDDIAMVLFYKISDVEDPIIHTAEFLPHFLRGYRQENQLDPAWLKDLPTFLKLREILLYAVFHHSFDPHNPDNEWVAGFMNGRKRKIEADVPYIDFDFESLVVYL
jgi:Ser/Thr protein kinase RdoA (MazF antagonist)